MYPKTSLIWTSFSGYLKNFISQKISSQPDVEDILQEVFVKIHLNINSLQNEKKLQSWVFSIARNVINDYHRKNLLTTDLQKIEIYTDEGADEFEKLKDCLRPFINKLPTKYKRALYLSDVKGMKQQEIAINLNLSLSGTKSRIQRAREMIKQNFISCCNFSTDNNGQLKGEH